jgi:hypothetical protein
VDEWLTRARDGVAAAGGVAPESLELGDADVEALLELARVAAHESGDRRNAPLLCYLVGVARGLGGAELETLREAVRRSTS